MSKNNDYIKNIENVERRFVNNPVGIVKRAEGEEDQPTIIEGYAAKFNERTSIGDWYDEEILPGAFDDVLKDDVRCLKNHDPSQILARSKNGKGTLTLSVDETGLKYSFEIPNRTAGRDLQDEIESGDISQSSFAFRAKETTWVETEGSGNDLRQIKKLERLIDVSPVTYPAYQDTTVAKRSHDAFCSKNESKSRAFDKYDAQYIFNQNNQ